MPRQPRQPQQPKPSAQVAPAVQVEVPSPRTTHVILIRSKKTGTLHTVQHTNPPGAILEFEDMEQAAAKAMSIPACMNNDYVLQEVTV